MAFYEEMQYLTAKQIQLVLDDLPEAIENGRSGEPAYTSVMAAQVTCTFTKLCRVQWWNRAECDIGRPSNGTDEIGKQEEYDSGPGKTLLCTVHIADGVPGSPRWRVTHEQLSQVLKAKVQDDNDHVEKVVTSSDDSEDDQDTMDKCDRHKPVAWWKWCARFLMVLWALQILVYTRAQVKNDLPTLQTR